MIQLFQRWFRWPWQGDHKEGFLAKKLNFTGIIA
jgi:hypothetical protein